MSKPWITFAIPSSNHAALLLETVRSVQTQIDPAWECCILDNCSYDSAWAVAQMLTKEDRRIQATRSPRFQTYDEQLLSAVGLGGAPYLVILQAGQVLNPTFVNVIHQAVSLYPDAGLYLTSRVSQCPPSRVTDDEKKPFIRWDRGKMTAYAIKRGNMTGQFTSAVFRREVLKGIVGDEFNNPWTPEYEMVVKGLSRHHVATIGQTVLENNYAHAVKMRQWLDSGELALFEEEALSRLLADEAVSQTVTKADREMAWDHIRAVRWVVALFSLGHGHWPRNTSRVPKGYLLPRGLPYGFFPTMIQILYKNWRATQ